MKIKKIKFKNIFIGNIYKRNLNTRNEISIDKCNSIVSLYKKNVIFLQVANNGFVELNKIKNYLVYLSLGNLVLEDGFIFGNKILTDIYNPLSDIEYFVSDLSLVQADIEDLDYSDIKKLKKAFKKR